MVHMVRRVINGSMRPTFRRRSHHPPTSLSFHWSPPQVEYQRHNNKDRIYYVFDFVSESRICWSPKLVRHRFESFHRFVIMYLAQSSIQYSSELLRIISKRLGSKQIEQKIIYSTTLFDKGRRMDLIAILEQVLQN